MTTLLPSFESVADSSVGGVGILCVDSISIVLVILVYNNDGVYAVIV